MRIGIMAAGGVGGYYGGVLTEAGRDVTLVARGAHLEALRTNGLRLTSVEGGPRTIPVKATPAEEAGVQDLVLFCVKTYSTEQAVETMRPMLGPETLVLTVQNGIDSAERLQALLGPEHAGNVLWGAAYISSHIRGPGDVEQVAGGWIVFGEGSGGRSERAERVREALSVPGMTAELSEYIHAPLWNKFIGICGLSGMTSVTRSPLGKIRNDERARAMLNQVLDEVEAVGRARGVRLDGERAKLMAFMDTLPDATTSSMAVDLIQGSRLEVDALHGTVSRMGRAADVPTPAVDFIYTVVKVQDRTGSA